MIGILYSTLAIACIMHLLATASIMGSGNASFFSFAPLTPQVRPDSWRADHPGRVPPAKNNTLWPRCIAITPAAVAIAGISPFQAVKRRAIPMAAVGL